ncbi:cytochrome P450 [Aspergillus aurantiobrunneus]
MGTAPLCGALLLLVWLRMYLRINTKSQDPQRQNIVVIEPSLYILKILHGVQYLWNGPEILRKAHVKDAPYAIRTPEAYQVHFSSRAHIKQLVQAPDTHLSLHALAKDMFQPKYTMNGLSVENCMSANGTIHQRALQAGLRSCLPAFKQPLADCIATALTEEIAHSTPIDGDWRSLHIFPMAKRLITRANALVFFGPKVCNDTTFLNAALEYPEHLMETAEALRLLPSRLAPFIAPYLMRGNRALNTLLDRLVPIVEARIAKSTTPAAAEHQDCIQFFVNAAAQKNQSAEWPASRIVQVLLGIWFASVHQPAMCLFYALDDLTLHPEYVPALREEIASGQHDITSLPLLNGFLKESARLNPTDSISLRRKVLHPFTLDDGTRLVKDDIACVPLQPILEDPDLYNSPLTFNPYRFMQDAKPNTILSDSNSNPRTEFTDADPTFPIWGLGKRACPGRFYASLLLKLVLEQILRRYELRMPEGKPGEKRCFYWRSAIVPRAGAVLLFRERIDV